MVFNGCGVKKDEVKAESYRALSAENGFPAKARFGP
jgi:hypothetical protein